jgi:hypothetical protein
MGLQERNRQKRIRQYVIERDGAICCYCDYPLTEDKITLEHIVADSHRGTFNTTNLTIACHPCNNKRGNKPFFDYCKQFNWSDDKLNKYKRLYSNNLKIKVLNISKEEHLPLLVDHNDMVIPSDLIERACQNLKIKVMDFSDYEQQYTFEIKFDELSHRKRIKFCFETLIRILEDESK